MPYARVWLQTNAKPASPPPALLPALPTQPHSPLCSHWASREVGLHDAKWGGFLSGLPLFFHTTSLGPELAQLVLKVSQSPPWETVTMIQKPFLRALPSRYPLLSLARRLAHCGCQLMLSDAQEGQAQDNQFSRALRPWIPV